MRSFTYLDLPFVASLTMGIRDTMESYTNGVSLNGLNGGIGWTGAYVARMNGIGLQAFDTMESYTNGELLNGLNGGVGWSGAYINDDDLYLGIRATDTMESYADAADVAGLNGGVGWSDAYVE